MSLNYAPHTASNADDISPRVALALAASTATYVTNSSSLHCCKYNNNGAYIMIEVIIVIHNIAR